MSQQTEEHPAPRRGRPRVEEPLASVSVRLPVNVHDRLCRIAQYREQSVSSLVRQLLVLRIKP
jgi:predicted HicB family RNase H-like nuclease